MTENILILKQFFGIEKLFENVAHIDVLNHLFGGQRSFFAQQVLKTTLFQIMTFSAKLWNIETSWTQN